MSKLSKNGGYMLHLQLENNNKQKHILLKNDISVYKLKSLVLAKLKYGDEKKKPKEADCILSLWSLDKLRVAECNFMFLDDHKKLFEMFERNVLRNDDCIMVSFRKNHISLDTNKISDEDIYQWSSNSISRVTQAVVCSLAQPEVFRAVSAESTKSPEPHEKESDMLYEWDEEDKDGDEDDDLIIW